MEIDLTQLVVGKYCLDDHWYRVEYEGLHLICSTCGCYGHLTRNCSKDLSGVATAPTTNGARDTDSALSICPEQMALGLGDRGKELMQEGSHSENLHAPHGSAVVVFNAIIEEGSSFDLTKGTHRDWMTVTRKKKEMPKKVNKKVLEGIKNLVDKSNKDITNAQVSDKHTPSEPKDAQEKKRRHEIAQSSSFTTGSTQGGKGKSPAVGDKAVSARVPIKAMTTPKSFPNKDKNDKSGPSSSNPMQDLPPKDSAKIGKGDGNRIVTMDGPPHPNHVRYVEMSTES